MRGRGFLFGSIFVAACGGSVSSSETAGDAGVDANSPVDAGADVADAASPRDGAAPPLAIACNAVQIGQPSPYNCSPSLCGNGRRDTCATGQRQSAEDCDGVDLQSQTCASLGYASGSLACDAVCVFDVRACESCMPNARTSACVHPSLGVAAGAVAIAATDTEIGVAWAEANLVDPPAKGMLHFTRMKPDFGFVADTACFGNAEATDVSLAATPSGWIVAAQGPSGATIASLDKNGAVGKTRSIAASGGVRLIERPGAGPLLLWIERANPNSGGPEPLHFQLLDADGAALTPDKSIAGVNLTWAGAFVGDGFELAANIPVTTDNLQLVHVALDGTTRFDAKIPGQQIYAASLAWSGTEMRLVYEAMVTQNNATAPATLFQRVSKDGALVGQPAQIDTLNAYASYPLFAAGDDTIALQTPNFGHMSSASVLRIAPSGAVSSPVPLVKTPLLASPSLARQGGDAVVAWIDSVPRGNPSDPLLQSRLGLARIKP